MVIGAISCVTNAFFMESLLQQEKKTNTIKEACVSRFHTYRCIMCQNMNVF